jgi:hypothetical protein
MWVMLRIALVFSGVALPMPCAPSSLKRMLYFGQLVKRGYLAIFSFFFGYLAKKLIS